MPRRPRSSPWSARAAPARPPPPPRCPASPRLPAAPSPPPPPAPTPPPPAAAEPVSMVDASLRATILGSLRKLTDEHGISILYIPHDLATAYQVADSILVLYRAHLAEAGGVERVVKEPRHPYTQLLISAIPPAHAARARLRQEAHSPRNDR